MGMHLVQRRDAEPWLMHEDCTLFLPLTLDCFFITNALGLSIRSSSVTPPRSSNNSCPASQETGDHIDPKA